VLKVDIVVLGKDKDTWVSSAVAHYRKLLSRYATLELITVPSPRLSASLSPPEIQKAEATAIEKHLPPGYLIGLSDRGKARDSKAFAGHLDTLQTKSRGRVVFVIGGPYGLDKALLKRCHETLSLSPLTFSHQLVRLVLLEQLYRGFSIIHGTDYHK
jgi:23S rRNA (pseudouridine1915-N3)-methyltransferase